MTVFTIRFDAVGPRGHSWLAKINIPDTTPPEERQALGKSLMSEAVAEKAAIPTDNWALDFDYSTGLGKVLYESGREAGRLSLVPDAEDSALPEHAYELIVLGPKFEQEGRTRSRSKPGYSIGVSHVGTYELVAPAKLTPEEQDAIVRAIELHYKQTPQRMANKTFVYFSWPAPEARKAS